jgi:hypothetical protein
MKRISVLIAALAVVSFAACGFEIIEGDGNIVDVEVDVEAFTGIHVTRGLCARVTEAGLAPVRLRGDANLLGRLEVSVDDDGELRIKPIDEDEMLQPSDGCIEVHASTPTLTLAHASAGSEIAADSMSGEELEIEASGGSEVNVGDITGDTLRVDLSGGSEALLRGAVEILLVNASGGSTGNLSLLLARAVDVDLSGGSHVELVAEEVLTGEASGGSTVVVEGDPSQETVDTSGGSSVDLR